MVMTHTIACYIEGSFVLVLLPYTTCIEIGEFMTSKTFTKHMLQGKIVVSSNARLCGVFLL